MEEQIRRFRELTSQLMGERPSRGVAYPEELREEALGCVHAARAQGRSLRELAVDLGVGASSLYSWVAIAKQAERGQDLAGKVVARPVAVRRVEVIPDARGRSECSGGLVLVTPQGYRVEGLGVGDVAQLLEVLR
jgi:transposase-like protein